MEFLRKLARKINGDVITRNLVLAACAVIVFVFVVSQLLNLFTRHGQVKVVPDFSGMTVEEALRAGRNASLRIEINDSLYVPAYPGGVILEQNPASGARVKSGRHIFVTINSFHQKKVEIPYVPGFSLRQAKNNIEMEGLEIKEIIYRNDIATNNVLEERYEGKAIRPGSKVEAEIGSGVTLGRLWEAGFNVGKISGDDEINALNEREAKVYQQTPATGSRQPLGTTVRLSITRDEKKLEDGHKTSDRDARAAAKAWAESEETTRDANE